MFPVFGFRIRTEYFKYWQFSAIIRFELKFIPKICDNKEIITLILFSLI